MEAKIREFDESTKSSALAAEALGCTVGEIAKSVVFVGARTAVVIISGDKRVSLTKLGAALGDEVRIATAEEAYARHGDSGRLSSGSVFQTSSPYTGITAPLTSLPASRASQIIRLAIVAG